MAEATFSVDTHLFRELGELLVGRESTALIELVKNAYDADATEIVIQAEALDTPAQGKIVITDNGVGMTPEQFQGGFLRVASRFKEEGERRSPKFKRRYTGAKGIGRLAAHKLARQLHIASYPSKDNPAPIKNGVTANIDWDKIEELQTLDQVKKSGAITLTPQHGLPIQVSMSQSLLEKAGTIIELHNLRKGWTEAERAGFLAEIQSYTPPDLLIKRDPKNIKKLLFDTAKVSDTEAKNAPFEIKLKGDFQGGEEYWQNLAGTAQWVFEVDANASEGVVEVAIAPTKIGIEQIPDAQERRLQFTHPNPESQLSFQARVFIREGGGGTAAERRWLGRTSGLRVFMEGFRVLPYGEPNDDWLSLDADYKRRSKTLPLLEKMPSAGNPVDDEEGLVFLGNQSYFGAIFLTLAGAPTLKMLVNREGFVPEPGYNALVDIMRKAVYFTVRVRAAAKSHTREERTADREASTIKAAMSRMDLRSAVEQSVQKASDLAQEARRLAASGDLTAAEAKITEAAAQFMRGSNTSERLMSEGAILRVLASVGLQMASFVHEINGLLSTAVAVERAVTNIIRDADLPATSRKRLEQLQRAVGELRRSVERQASYLTDIVSPDARRRRSRQRLAERFEAARKLVADTAQKRQIEIINNIPPDLKSPSMFPAELTLVFTNLLTNAVKAVRENGKIKASAVQNQSAGEINLRIENTGASVDLSEAERWFRPFESTTENPDPVLGQGMGMGLPITRNTLEEYGARIHFAKPSKSYATAVEIIFPGQAS